MFGSTAGNRVPAVEDALYIPSHLQKWLFLMGYLIHGDMY